MSERCPACGASGFSDDGCRECPTQAFHSDHAWLRTRAAELAAALNRLVGTANTLDVTDAAIKAARTALANYTGGTP